MFLLHCSDRLKLWKPPAVVQLWLEWPGTCSENTHLFNRSRDWLLDGHSRRNASWNDWINVWGCWKSYSDRGVALAIREGKRLKNSNPSECKDFNQFFWIFKKVREGELSRLCTAIIAFCSKKYQESKNCQHELKYASVCNIPMPTAEATTTTGGDFSNFIRWKKINAFRKKHIWGHFCSKQ